MSALILLAGLVIVCTSATLAPSSWPLAVALTVLMLRLVTMWGPSWRPHLRRARGRHRP